MSTFHVTFSSAGMLVKLLEEHRMNTYQHTLTHTLSLTRKQPGHSGTQRPSVKIQLAEQPMGRPLEVGLSYGTYVPLTWGGLMPGLPFQVSDHWCPGCLLDQENQNGHISPLLIHCSARSNEIKPTASQARSTLMYPYSCFVFLNQLFAKSSVRTGTLSSSLFSFPWHLQFLYCPEIPGKSRAS